MKKRVAPPPSAAQQGNDGCSEEQAANEESSSKKLRPSAAVNNKQREQKTPRIDYKGFSLAQGTSKFQIPVEDPSISPQDFFAKYIATRTPCIINGLPPPPTSNQNTTTTRTIITPALLKEHAGDRPVQVEKRFNRAELFGQNRTKSRQFVTSVSKFVDQLVLSNDGDLLYLSTQQQQVEASDGDDDAPKKKSSSNHSSSSVFGVPCQQLLEQGLIPESLSWAGNLLLQSCNLWMGSSVDGSCSGLHHDYHDNFYLLHQGRKQFRLFSPDMADTMYIHGTIERVHPNGLISHVGNELRSDGVPWELLSACKEDQEEENDPSDEDDEEEELVLGKGFDYKSDSEEEGDDFDEALFQDDNYVMDDYDAVVGDEDDNDEVSDHNQGCANKSQHNKRGTATQDETTKDADNAAASPDSFSRVDLSLPRDTLENEFPLFPGSCLCVVDLNAGQSLYLPASWFHSVTSFAERNTTTSTVAPNNNDNDTDARPAHTAVNYWYHPPDQLDRYADPYQDDFWKTNY